MASPYRSLYTTLRKPLQALSPIATIAVCYIPSMRLASSAPGPSRRQITVTNDDGRIRWGELTMREKAARSTQQSVNVATIIVGFVLTGAVATLLYTEVFAVESKTNHYIRAVNQVKRDPRCIALLGRSKEIISYGEPTWNKWRRARPIA
ncbi:MAG: mitochondrial import inner membrane translocase subunit tim21 [Trizodia sp. TS-e1964]|nr:MAG: mitochondrial import inner membrane translocase subunit tim21 [Trizodia sp. TS-e1964]